MGSVRQQINIAVGPRRVWRALTTVEGLCTWWASSARVDPREGGRIVLFSEDSEGAKVERMGLFLSFRPTRRLEIKWDGGENNDAKGTSVNFHIARDGDETRVNIVQSGEQIDGEGDAVASLEQAWKGTLLSLREALEGE
jgi:uncharacterized protein YndB with AHSA1/START domain